MIVETNGVFFYFEATGKGEPLLLLHGWGGCAASMKPLAGGLQDIRSIYNVDFPGFGQSSHPKEPWSVTEYTECLASFMKLAGIDKADIIAHSFGGRVTLLLAATHPELVGKIVITGGAGLKPKRDVKYHIRVSLYKLGRAMLKRPALTKLLKAIGIDLEKMAKSAGSEDYRSLSEDMKKTIVRVVNQDLRWCLPKIKSSTLLIWGDGDNSAPLWMGKIMEKEIPDAGLVVFEGCGHFAYLEQLPRFVKIVRTFLGGKA